MHYIHSHARIVAAFILREIATRYGRSPGGYIWAFIEPLAFVFIMTTLMSSFGRSPPIGDSFVLFYSTGYMGFSLYRTMETYLASSISANRALMSYPVVAPIDAVVGRLILQGVTIIVVTTIIGLGAISTSRHPHAIEWRAIIEAASLAWTLALGVATINIVLFFLFPLYQKIYEIISRPLLLLSGVFYMPNMMPHPISDYILFNPISHVVLLFRAGFYGYPSTAGLDTAYLVEISSATLSIGMILFTFFNITKRQSS